MQMAQSGIEAVDNEIRETTPESMDLEALLDELDLNGIPTKKQMSLVQQGTNSLTTTLQQDAWQNAGITLNSAGKIDTYYYE